MHLSLSCAECVGADGRRDRTLYRVELQDDRLYWLTCRQGHKTATILQEQRFEVLSGVAANAIVDGYYREAVASFTSALERFYEFYIEVMARKSTIAPEQFAAGWKLIDRQSERQLGAYVMLYLREQGKPPPMLSNKLMEFRNSVIHRGKIPTRQQALSYGQAVIDVVAPVLDELKAHEFDHVMAVVVKNMSVPYEAVEGSKMSTMTMTMPLSISAGGAQRPLEKSIVDIAAMRAVGL